MDSVLRTVKLDSGYERHVVVSGIEIEVHRGEILTLIGPNGAGKSTVLKTIAGQLMPLGGAIYIDDKEYSTYTHSEISKYRSVMLTERMSAEQMTCREVVSLGRYPYTGKLGILSADDKRIVRESMELVHTEDLGSRDFHAISDGQRQRVLLARAICQEPKLMILDEPTSYLDIRHKLEFLDLLRKLVRDRDIGVIMSMHELELAYMVSDRVVCITEDGKIHTSGTPSEVFTDEQISGLFGLEPGRLRDLYSVFVSNLTGQNNG